MKGVRLRLEGWEGQCDSCRQWWPLEEDHWIPKDGMAKCRACHNEVRRLYVRNLRNANPDMRARHREQSMANQREKRRVGRDAYLEYKRRWWAANHVRLMAEAAERHAIKLELAGKKPGRKSPRVETPETRAYRREFRQRWEEKHGPITPPKPTDESRRTYNREWMRAYRRERAA